GIVEIGLTILHDPAVHGTVADPQLEGLDPKCRAVLVVDRAKYAIVYDPQSTPPDLVAEAARQAQILTPLTAAVFSLEAISSSPSVALANVPRPEPGPSVRPSGVAGKFYPDDAGELAKMVEELLGTKRKTKGVAAALVPHAGLRFSGPVAAAVFRRLAIPPTVIVLGPKHT